MHVTSDLMVAYIDEELPRESAREVAAHIAVCAACNRLVADLRAASGQVLGVLQRIDAVEPAEWSAQPKLAPAPMLAAADATRIDSHQPVIRARAWPRAGTAPLRRAATILLLTATAAAAIVATDRILRVEETPALPVPPTVPTAAPASNGISVESLNGLVIVTLSGVGAESRLQAVVEDRSDVRLVINGVETPRFVAAAGRIDADLGGKRADLRLLVPATITEARIMIGADTVAVVRGRVVLPAQAAEAGILLPIRKNTR